ncbi:MAG: hypothetical protein QOI11_1261 [Candidatus Eremiobacteraeota bacterium]|nr:hypothetical protein [Candidatus Eremiobacteraeota bacterium]
MDDAVTRRRFVREAGVAAVAASELLIAPTQARPRKRRPRRRQTVAVFGGGIAGLTAAHELAERGFDVTVYERRAWGGKARSTEVPDSATGGRRPLPGEHGWRAWPGFYKNTTDTMRRIPFGTNPRGALDNLVTAPNQLFARDGGRRDLLIPFGVPDLRGDSPEVIIDLVVGAAVELSLPPQAVTHLANRVAVFFSSCDERRIGQWEHTSAADFLGADRYGDDYRKIIVNTFTEVVQASKAESTSAAFSGHFLEFAVYNLLGLNSNGNPDVFRLLNAPTNEALIDPWLGVLRGFGVRLRNHHELKRLVVRDGQLIAVRVQGPGGPKTVTADWYVCALPVERARRLWNPGILAADPHLGRMWNLDTGWMNGVKFFLRRQLPLARGIADYLDSPWLISSVSQTQFWHRDFAATYGDGQARESFSAIVSRWTGPGVLYGKAAEDCTPDEVVHEVWEQMKRHLNDTGRAVLTDDMLHSYEIDPGMLRRKHRLISDDPLVLPSVGQRPDRPDVATAVPNLILAGDYLKSEWEVANMETASFNARRAANAILERAGSREPPVRVIKPYRPPEWEPLKRIDEQRYARGEPNLLDLELTLEQVKELLRSPLASLTT